MNHTSLLQYYLCGYTTKIKSQVPVKTIIFSPYRKAIKIAFCYANWELKKSFEISILKSPKCHGTKCHAILPWHNYVTKIFSKSTKCHRTKCHDILPWHNYVTKNFSKSPKCHGTKCHAILPWHNNGTKILAKSPKCHLRKCHDIFCQADEQTLRCFHN